MEVSINGNGDYVLVVDRREVLALNNALNETCNGSDIAVSEFETRVGTTRRDARGLLSLIGTALARDRPIPKAT